MRLYIGFQPNRNFATLKELKYSLASRLINRLDYSSQTAKRAECDGADIELIVAALIHDVGKTLAPKIIPRCPQQLFGLFP